MASEKNYITKKTKESKIQQNKQDSTDVKLEIESQPDFQNVAMPHHG